jgi:molybdenum cofactor synthesis domain-containing protein
MLRTRLGAEVSHTQCVPDEADKIVACFLDWSRPERAIDLVLSTGGTGLSPRDVTPEAARSVFEREHPGLMELARFRCLSRSPLAFLSRGVGGTIRRTLILTLPGSLRGATEHLDALLDVLPHAVEALRNEPHDDPRIATHHEARDEK